MWFRLAQKALALGRERREEAAAAEKAEAAAEKARVVAEEKAERERVAKEAKQQQHRERFQRSMQESDERWAQLDEQTRRENAAWEADRPERERREREAAAMQTRAPTSTKGGERPPARPTSPHAASPVRQPVQARAATTPSAATTSPSPRSPALAPGPMPTRRTAGPGSQPPALSLQTQPATRTSPPTDHPRRPSQSQPADAERRVRPSRTALAWTRQSVPWPPPAASTTKPLVQSPRAPAPPTPVPAVALESARAAVSMPARSLTGADLAAWRAARGLTQRPAADLLGVAPSTVAKAELLPGKVLGDQLQVALAAALGP